MSKTIKKSKFKRSKSNKVLVSKKKKVSMFFSKFGISFLEKRMLACNKLYFGSVLKKAWEKRKDFLGLSFFNAKKRRNFLRKRRCIKLPQVKVGLFLKKGSIPFQKVLFFELRKRFFISQINYKLEIPYNGCRKKKIRRV